MAKFGQTAILNLAELLGVGPFGWQMSEGLLLLGVFEVAGTSEPGIMGT